MFGLNTNKVARDKLAMFVIVAFLSLLATKCIAVGSSSKRTLFKGESTYTVAPPDIVVTYSVSSVNMDPLIQATLSMTASRDVDVHIEYRGFQNETLMWGLYSDSNDRGSSTGSGGYVNRTFGWFVLEYFDGVYVSSIPDEVTSYYTWGYDKWVGMGAGQIDFRFKLRYVDSGQIVTTRWYYPESLIFPHVPGSSSPVIADNGVEEAFNFDFGETQAVVAVIDMEITDGSDPGSKIALFSKVVRRVSGEVFYGEPTPYVECGAGIDIDTANSRLPYSIDEMAASSDPILDAYVRIVDADGNNTGWILVQEIDTRDHD